MQDINFISGSGGGSKRSKGKKQSRDIQYTTGEVLDATQKMNPAAPKKQEKGAKKPAGKKKAKKKSFFEWRTEREMSAQEKAEIEERKQREQEEKEARKDEKKREKENEKRIAKERERFQEEMKEAKKRSQKKGKQTRPTPAPKKPVAAPVPVPEPPKKPKQQKQAVPKPAPKASTQSIAKKRSNKVHAAPEEHHGDTPELLHAQEPGKETHAVRMHVAGDAAHETPSSNLLEGSVYSMPAPAGPTAEKADKKTRTRKGSAKIHVPPAIESHKPKRKLFTLTRQEMDTSALDVNLIPDEILDQLRARNYLRELVYVALAGIMVVLIAFAALNIYQRKIATDTATLETQIQEFDSEIAGYIALQTEISALSQRLESLHNVLEAHVYWSPFLEKLEELTLATVYYTGMTGSANTGQFTFNAVAKSYQDVDAQVRVLRQAPEVLSVSVTSVAATQATATEESTETTTATGEQTVSFIIAIEFDAELFEYGGGELGMEHTR